MHKLPRWRGSTAALAGGRHSLTSVPPQALVPITHNNSISGHVKRGHEDTVGVKETQVQANAAVPGDSAEVRQMIVEPNAQSSMFAAPQLISVDRQQPELDQGQAKVKPPRALLRRAQRRGVTQRGLQPKRDPSLPTDRLVPGAVNS